MQGRVATGYGRGSKKLGFPTANLPYFDSLLASSGLSNGVYVGWATVCHPTLPTTRLTVVSNIGYSPTFAGQENKVRIVESYLLPHKDVVFGDFYGSYLRLFLIGFLRPEIKFGSLAELTAQIRADVEAAGALCGTDSAPPSPALPAPLPAAAQKWLLLGYGDEASSDAATQAEAVTVEVPHTSSPGIEKHVCLWARPTV